MRIVFVSALAALAACTVDTASEQDELFDPPPLIVTHIVTVNSDGSFSPRDLHIKSGERVVWNLYDRTDTIIHTTNHFFPDMCHAPARYDATDPNELTGPMPHSPGGIFALSPNPKPPGLGFAEYQGSCGIYGDHGSVGTTHLCAAGAPRATMDSTWSDPAISGVFIRLLWSDIEYAPGQYHYDVLDHEIDKAIANGKMYSLALEAGKFGTPTWLASDGIETYTFRDTGSSPDKDPDACGTEVPNIGRPWGYKYKQRYFAMLTGIADHLKRRADYYRALAYVKPSGANFLTTENRLPNGCQARCTCNDEIWANQAGYTPSKLEGYYAAQFDAIAAAFPGKTMSYELIQDGFPQINDAGGYVDADDKLTAGTSQIGLHAQTNAIIADGEARYPDSFAVQHCGLQEKPADACYGRADDPKGCPNRWVTDASAAGFPTLFQTDNTNNIDDLPKLDSALENGRDNSDAALIEVYEERVWESRTRGNPDLGPSQNSLEQWDAFFRGRAAPISHEHTFTRTVASGSQTFYYYNGTRCGAPGSPQYGTITIDP